MLPALRHGGALSDRVVVTRIQTRQYSLPKASQPKPPPVWVSPERVRLEEYNKNVASQRLKDARTFHLASVEMVETSKLREFLRWADDVPRSYYMIGAIVVTGAGYIWWSYRKERKQEAALRKAVMTLEEFESQEGAAALDNSKLPRPLVVVGGDSQQKSAILQKLVRGREQYFGLPVLHTSRKARQKENDGRKYWFAPRDAVEQGIYLGAFLSHGTIRVGDKYVMYGLSKGAVADVRTAGRICLLDVDLEAAEALSKTDLNPIIVLVATPEELVAWDREAAKEMLLSSESSFTGMADAWKKGFFRNKVLLQDNGDKSLEAACDGVLGLLEEQFELAGAHIAS